jgi:hypothetical protein
VDALDGMKKNFFSEQWVEQRHHYLKSLSPRDARRLAESLTPDEIVTNVNVRRFQQDYIADYLDDLWSISHGAFWNHVTVMLKHPEGIIMSDNMFYQDTMSGYSVPHSVWSAMVESLLPAKPWYHYDVVLSVMRSQILQFDAGNRKRESLAKWLDKLSPADWADLQAALGKGCDAELQQWLKQMRRS